MADVEVVFVNELAASGFVNGVINMAFSTYQFIPGTNDKDEMVVLPAPEITANLRFDLRLAMILRDRLQEIIEDNTKPARPAN